MVKTVIPCADCGGRVILIRDLEDEQGAAELEGHHRPDCRTATFTRPELSDREANP